MEDEYLRHYVKEVVRQAQVVEISKRRLDELIATSRSSLRGMQRVSPVEILAAAQGVLAPCTSISLLLWPSEPLKDYDGELLSEEDKVLARAWANDRARSLRRALKPQDQQQSPLAFRRVRHALEHYDEYLDAYLRAIEAGRLPGIIVDNAVGPRDMISYGDATPLYLRHFDPSTSEFTVLSFSQSMSPLMEELGSVKQQAVAWLKERNLI